MQSLHTKLKRRLTCKEKGKKKMSEYGLEAGTSDQRESDGQLLEENQLMEDQTTNSVNGGDELETVDSDNGSDSDKLNHVETKRTRRQQEATPMRRS